MLKYGLLITRPELYTKGDKSLKVKQCSETYLIPQNIKYHSDMVDIIPIK